MEPSFGLTRYIFPLSFRLYLPRYINFHFMQGLTGIPSFNGLVRSFPELILGRHIRIFFSHSTPLRLASYSLSAALHSLSGLNRASLVSPSWNSKEIRRVCCENKLNYMLNLGSLSVFRIEKSPHILFKEPLDTLMLALVLISRKRLEGPILVNTTRLGRCEDYCPIREL